MLALHRGLKLLFCVQLLALTAVVVFLGVRWTFVSETPVAPEPVGALEQESQQPGVEPDLPEAREPEAPAVATMAPDPVVLRASRAIPDVPSPAPEPVLPEPEDLRPVTPAFEAPPPPLGELEPPPTLAPERPSPEVATVPPRRARRTLSRFAGTPDRPHRYVRGLQVRLEHRGSAPAASVEWSGLEPPVSLVLQQVRLHELRWFGGDSAWSVKPFEDLRWKAPVPQADGPELSVYLVGVASAHGIPGQGLAASASPDAGASAEAGPDASASPAPPRAPPPATLYVDGACA
jgi:hypothetical protein